MRMNIFHVLVDPPFIERNDAKAIISPAWWSMNTTDGYKAYEHSLEGFPLAQRLFAALQWYKLEVDNGGHEQFYWNSTGIVWADALEALQMLGESEFEAILEASVRRMGGKPPFDRARRHRVLDRLEHSFDDLDNRFYALDRKLDLKGRMTAFMRQHAEVFCYDGLIERPDV